MSVTIVGNNTPTAGGVVYGDGTNYASTAAGTSGQVLQSNGSSAPTWSTPTVTSPAGSTGQVQYNNAGAFGAVSSGTSGQVLTSAGSGAAPTWTTPSAGAMTLISSNTLTSGQASLSITGMNFSTYKLYVVEVLSVICSAVTNYYIQVSTDNGSSWKTSGYLNSMLYSNGISTTAVTALGSNTTAFRVGPGFGSAAYPACVKIEFPSPSPTSPSGFASFRFTGEVNPAGSGPDIAAAFGGGFNNSGYGDYNAIKIFPSSGTFTSGIINVYGVT
jgi:hypothetical protein